MITRDEALKNPELMIKHKDDLKDEEIFKNPWYWAFDRYPYLYREFSDRFDEMDGWDISCALVDDSTLVLDLKNHLHKINEEHLLWLSKHRPELSLCMKYCNNPDKAEAAYYVLFPHKLNNLNKEEKRKILKKTMEFLQEEKEMPRFYNKQSSKDIDWCDYSFNPFTGCWGPGGDPTNPEWCSYCYAHPIARRYGGSTAAFPYKFEPTYYPNRMSASTPSAPSRIFLGSMGDLGGDWRWRNSQNPDETVSTKPLQRMVFDYCNKNPQHQYILLTKNPGGIRRDAPLPPNMVFGVSVPGTGEKEEQRLSSLEKMQSLGVAPRVVVSYEPALRTLPNLWPVKDDTGWLLIGVYEGPARVPIDSNNIQKASDMAEGLGWRVWVMNSTIKQLPPRMALESTRKIPNGPESEPVDSRPAGEIGWPQDALSLPKNPQKEGQQTF